MKVGFLITGRLKSTRLKEKLLLKVQGREYIRWMIDRVKLSKCINEIILCTSTNGQDDLLEKIAVEENIKCYRGDEDDVILRLSKATEYYNLDFVLNITADCPLVSYEYSDKIIKEYLNTNADFIQTLKLPHGLFLYGIKPSSMKKICRFKKDNHTEVWGKYFTDTGHFDVLDLEIPKSLQRPSYRLTLDYPEDHEFFKKIFDHFGDKTYTVPIKDIISFLDKNPSIVKINKDCRRKYLERWNSQNNIKF